MTKLKLIAWLGAVVAVVWLGGFLRFVSGVSALNGTGQEADAEAVDAVVVLTGGSERVLTGIKLLEAGTGKKLFISGVNKKLTLESMVGLKNVPADLRACCIVLGYQAGSTIGNAEETRDWMANEGYTSLRLVTANYHMPRSLLLFHAAMPEVKIVPNPVAPENVKLTEWEHHTGTVELLITEYDKYLFALAKTGLEALAAKEGRRLDYDP